jgi:hypothetical protein
MTPSPRELWQRLETIHAVVYFAPEVREALAGVGLRGFWMGYFASRVAALGPVSADVVTATCFNFHPTMVGRAIPDAWSFASPAAVLETRATSVEAALRRLLDDVAIPDAAVALAVRAAREARIVGRPLAAAHRAVPEPTSPIGRLWWAATVLREHRGDGHVAALVAQGIDGCEAHVLQAGAGAAPTELLRANRGWSEDDWRDAVQRLAARGLVDGEGRLTAAGSTRKDEIELATDRLSARAFDVLSAAERTELSSALDLLVGRIVAADAIPFPNPMGLPRPSR